MNPNGVLLRESRDSDEHPNSFPIIIALDVTGSMLDVPHRLVTTGLPKIMSAIIQSAGFSDAQVLFMAFGDHEMDRAPLQIGQFETNDEALDKWLTSVYMEGGGGSNPGESYHLPWFFASRYTEIDSFAKRGHKGILITIGDEPVLPTLPASDQKAIMGDGQYEDETATSLLNAARKKYDVYHIHTTETNVGRRSATVAGWKHVIGQDLVVVENTDGIVKGIIDIVTKHVQLLTETPTVPTPPAPKKKDEGYDSGNSAMAEEVIL